jgi:tRNA1(Val) A37 N6-methylase TrmN6
VRVLHGDLRDPDLLPAGARFDLVTANPPFQPPGTATASPVAQRACARQELHGDVFAYAAAAARWSAPGAFFVFCHDARDDRPARALEAAGLPLRGRRVLRFREGGPPRLAVYVAGGPGPAEAACAEPPALTVRDAHGQITPQWRAVRRDLLIDA